MLRDPLNDFLRQDTDDIVDFHDSWAMLDDTLGGAA